MGGSLSLCLQLQSRMDIILLRRHAAPQRSRGRGEFAREFEPHRWEPSATAPATKVQSVTTRNYNIRLIWTYIATLLHSWRFHILKWRRYAWFLTTWRECLKLDEIRAPRTSALLQKWSISLEIMRPHRLQDLHSEIPINAQNPIKEKTIWNQESKRTSCNLGSTKTPWHTQIYSHPPLGGSSQLFSG